MTTAVNPHRLRWILAKALETPHTRHAILFSADGLLMAHSEDIGRDDADTAAATLAGLQSLARNTAALCGNAPTQWRQSINEFDGGYVLLMAAGTGAYVAVSATEQVKLADLTFGLQDVVQRLGQELTSPPRQDTGSPA
jgi:predicted regulator of Ras-like GTPase activity (Roadblock/LC7/MglB family)